MKGLYYSIEAQSESISSTNGLDLMEVRFSGTFVPEEKESTNAVFMSLK